jgi:SH3 domain protein
MYRLFLNYFSLTAPTFLPSRQIKILLLPLLLLLFFLTLPQHGLAQETEYRYVSDEFRITLRSGPAASFKVIRMLKTGMKLTLLEKGNAGWDKVQAANGAQGWVLRRFIRTKIPARVRVVEIEAAYNTVVLERDSLKEQLAVATLETASKQEVEQELSKIKAISSKSVILDRENRELTQKLSGLEERFAKVSLENDKLVRQTDTRFFLAGAAVLILGVIIGAILFRRRRPSYGTL